MHNVVEYAEIIEDFYSELVLLLPQFIALGHIVLPLYLLDLV